ncbi:MAG: SulP family inorganic anion transporter [Chloroflexota bacterium]
MKFLPITTWLPHYDRTWFRPDIIAALTTWALVVPQAIAYGQLAGLPAQAGLYTAFAALLAYAFFGTSRQLVVSPTSSTAIISAALIAPLATGNTGNMLPFRLCWLCWWERYLSPLVCCTWALFPSLSLHRFRSA